MDNKLHELIKSTVGDLGCAVSTQNVVGDAIFTPDGMTLIPLSKASFGFGGGGTDKPGGLKDSFNAGTAAGVKLEPVGFLVVKDGFASFLSVSPNENNSVERVLDTVPKILDKFERIIGENR